LISEITPPSARFAATSQGQGPGGVSSIRAIRARGSSIRAIRARGSSVRALCRYFARPGYNNNLPSQMSQQRDAELHLLKTHPGVLIRTDMGPPHLNGTQGGLALGPGGLALGSLGPGGVVLWCFAATWQSQDPGGLGLGPGAVALRPGGLVLGRFAATSQGQGN